MTIILELEKQQKAKKEKKNHIVTKEIPNEHKVV